MAESILPVYFMRWHQLPFAPCPMHNVWSWRGDLQETCQHRTQDEEERWVGVCGAPWDIKYDHGLTCRPGHHVTCHNKLESEHEVVDGEDGSKRIIVKRLSLTEASVQKVKRSLASLHDQ